MCVYLNKQRGPTRAPWWFVQISLSLLHTLFNNTDTIPSRELGHTGAKVASIGLSVWGRFCATFDLQSVQFALDLSPPKFEFLGHRRKSLLSRTIHCLITTCVVSDIFASGKNEELLAKVLKTLRNEVFLGLIRASSGEYLGVSGKPEYVHQALEASLKKLQVDYVDLYYQHRTDPNVPIEDTVGAMAELVKEGKVCYLGLSACSADTLRRAYAVHPIAALQIGYSPWSLDIEENGVLETARELVDRRLRRERLSVVRTALRRRNFPKNLDIVRRFEEFAKVKGITSSQLDLARVLAQGQDFIPILGTKCIKHLEANVGSANVTLLRVRAEGD
ncbi:LOW QUALITY PROTEIN: auxin-induced protein [Jimgerdemannia flammicorona]|uniref:Auxin-induced protein n=1 Tax=Jimgerdemannia flammicorona TaxID=994334 RepID=A0A433Q581_9FUNG|nr:LOW QUALITY PROTEIN: auxin-induced protein [Jimgerdemannia flammicorona]